MSKPSFRSIDNSNSVFASTSIIHGGFVCIVTSLITNFSLLFIFSIFLNFVKGPAPMLQLCTKIAWVIGMFFGGFSMGRNRNNKGWFWGLAGGACYLVFGMLLSLFITKDMGYNSGTISLILSGLFAGMFGGIISINKGHHKESNIRSSLR